eukprot:m.175852 g.175852  ORF g.175852 m.175852 type:complete len:546 (-) comp14625_c0_seq1:701-2338(-)
MNNTTKTSTSSMFHNAVLVADIHQHLRAQEVELQKRDRFCLYEVTDEARRVSVQWIADAARRFNMSPHTRDTATIHFDRALTKLHVPESNLDIVAASCLILAGKCTEQEEHLPPFAHVLDTLPHKYTRKDLESVELTILKSFEWCLATVTASDFVEFYARYSVTPSDCECEQPVQDLDELEGRVCNLAQSLLEVGNLDHDLMHQRASVRAAAAVTAARHQLNITPTWSHLLQAVAHVSFDDVQSCYQDTLRVAQQAANDSAAELFMDDSVDFAESSPSDTSDVMDSSSSGTVGLDGDVYTQAHEADDEGDDEDSDAVYPTVEDSGIAHWEWNVGPSLDDSRRLLQQYYGHHQRKQCGGAHSFSATTFSNPYGRPQPTHTSAPSSYWSGTSSSSMATKQSRHHQQHHQHQQRQRQTYQQGIPCDQIHSTTGEYDEFTHQFEASLHLPQPEHSLPPVCPPSLPTDYFTNAPPVTAPQPHPNYSRHNPAPVSPPELKRYNTPTYLTTSARHSVVRHPDQMFPQPTWSASALYQGRKGRVLSHVNTAHV